MLFYILRKWMFVCCECCVLSGRGRCHELITRPEESYRLWCVVVCDQETSWMRRPFPTGAVASDKKENNSFADEACSRPCIIEYPHKNSTLAFVWARLMRFLPAFLSMFRAGFGLARFYNYTSRFINNKLRYFIRTLFHRINSSKRLFHWVEFLT